MTFVADVIYGLKLENPSRIVVTHTSAENTNLITGDTTSTTTSFTLNNVIVLDSTLRETFMKMFGSDAVGLQNLGDQVILIDQADLRGNLIDLDDSILVKGRQTEVVKVTQIEEAYLVAVKFI